MRGFEMGEKKEKRGLILTDVICSEARALEAFRGKALPGGRQEATHCTHPGDCAVWR